MTVSNFSGSWFINSSAQLILAAFIICSSVAFDLKKEIFSLIVPENTIFFWGTYAKYFLTQQLISISSLENVFKKILPLSGEYTPSKSIKSVLFPTPDGPQIKVKSPLLIVKYTFFKTSSSLYPKVTLCIFIHSILEYSCPLYVSSLPNPCSSGSSVSSIILSAEAKAP